VSFEQGKDVVHGVIASSWGVLYGHIILWRNLNLALAAGPYGWSWVSPIKSPSQRLYSRYEDASIVGLKSQSSCVSHRPTIYNPTSFQPFESSSPINSLVSLLLTHRILAPSRRQTLPLRILNGTYKGARSSSTCLREHCSGR